MAHIQYWRTVPWDTTLRDVGTTGSGLAINGLKNTTGAPAATAGYFQPSCIISNIVDGTAYINSGTTASPVWSLLETNASGGFSLPASGTDAVTTTGNSFALTMNSVTTGNGINQSVTGLTTGNGIQATGGTAMTATAALFKANLGAAVLGSGFDVVTTGVYTDVSGLVSVTAANATTGTLVEVVGGAASLTGAGRYVALSDGALNVFSVGPNGHLHSLQTTAPTIAVTTQAGITAAAVTAGSTDTCGTVTTTGTSTGGSVLTLTFNKTYVVAPKFAIINENNTAAVTGQVSATSTTATTVVFTIPVASGATPSWTYFVFA